MDDEDLITVGFLREQLRGYSDDTELGFGTSLAGFPLIFYRVKSRGDNFIQIELSEKIPPKTTYTIKT